VAVVLVVLGEPRDRVELVLVVAAGLVGAGAVVTSARALVLHAERLGREAGQ
jgi:hypothetical protein